MRTRHRRRHRLIATTTRDRHRFTPPIRHLHIHRIIPKPQPRRTVHRVIRTKTILATPHHDIEPEMRDVGGCAGDCECEEGLVGATDGDAGGVGPVLGGAGGEDCAGHAVAQEGEGEEPEEEEEGVECYGEFGGEAAGAGDEGCEEDV